MTSEHWLYLKQLIGDALERSGDARSAFLDAACAGDAQLRAEVDALLAAEDGDELVSPFAGWRPAPRDAAGDAAGDEDLAGQRVGPYEIVRLLGRGGMGAVYEVVRADGHFTLRGALKLIRPGVDSPALRQRFRQERQILASLNHSNIARLLDGGLRADGLPYLVMEYVEGVPLLQFCDEHQRSTEARLDLFLQVCEAVQFAHRNLVIHRDLKPSNILVTPEGQVKLLDFGIAKLFDTADTEDVRLLTRTALQPFTPEYAAPEQVAGGQVTTATDVYQLGAVLYELLAGRRPFDLSGLTPAAVERFVSTAEPQRPSMAVYVPPTRLDGAVRGPDAADTRTLDPEVIGQRRGTRPDRLQRRLNGDLDNIVLKALRKEPEQRYASVEQFADDLRRHLSGKPVLARPATLGYRTAKFLRRYRTAVAATALVALALVTAAGVSVRQARQAEIERQKAVQVSAFLQDMFAAPDPYQDGHEVRVVEVLDRSAEKIETDLRDQPEVEAAVRHTLGVTYHELGLYEPAEAHLRRALSLRERLHGARHAEVSETQSRLGLTYLRLGDYHRADSLFQHALATDRALFGAEHTRIAGRLNDLGVVQWEQGNYEAAEPYLRQALALEERLRGPGHDEVAVSLGNLAALLAGQGDHEEAERLHRRELAILRANHGDEDPRVPQALSHIGIIRDDLEDHETAVALHAEALALYRKIKGETHPDVAYAMNNLAAARAELGAFDEAAALQNEAAAIYEDALGSDHPNLGIQYNNMGRTRRMQGDVAGAEAAYRRAVEIWRASLPEGHPYLGYGLSNLGAVLLAQDRLHDALPLLREAYDLRAAFLPPDNPELANTASILGEALGRLGQTAEAESLLVASYDVLYRAFGEAHAMSEGAAERLAAFYQAHGQSGERVLLEEGE